jgi:hydrogenase-4 component B
MLAPMGVLAALCLALGVLPSWLLGGLVRTVAPFLGEGAALAPGEWYMVGFRAAAATGAMSPAALAALLLAGAAAAMVAYRIFGRPVRAAGETWTCGIVPTARMEYTATGFSDPIRRAFAAILLPKPDVVVDEESHRYFGRKMVFHVKITYVFTEAVYRPASRGVVALANFMKRLQTGSVQLYVGYILAVTIAVLVWSTGW